jgi:hypothetical protein
LSGRGNDYTHDGGQTGETDGDVCVDIEVDLNCETVDGLVLRSSTGWAGGYAPRRDTWARPRLSDSLVAES